LQYLDFIQYLVTILRQNTLYWSTASFC